MTIRIETSEMLPLKSYKKSVVKTKKFNRKPLERNTSNSVGENEAKIPKIPKIPKK